MASETKSETKNDALMCPVCRTTEVHLSHRRGRWERGPLTWFRIFPFRCGECYTRFYRFAREDPRRLGVAEDAARQNDRAAARWNGSVPAAVTVHEARRGSMTLKGTAVNETPEGVRVLLPRALSKDTVVGVKLKGGITKLGRIRWAAPQDDLVVLHEVRFQVPPDEQAAHLLATRWLRWRKRAAQALFVLFGVAAIVGAVYALTH